MSKHKIIEELARVFGRWQGPDGQQFKHRLLKEFEMGQLAKAWTEIEAEIAALKAQPPATFTTPNGVVLDAEDAATIDTIIASAPAQPTTTGA